MNMLVDVKPRENKTILSDEEIVQEFQQGDDDAFNVLVKKYEYLVCLKVKMYFLLGGDREDLLQEAKLGLYKATRDFKIEGKSSFRGFAELCITRQLITVIKAGNRQKHSPLNNALSLNISRNSKRAEDDITLMEMLPHPHAVSPEKAAVESENKREREQILQEILSTIEQDVFSLYMKGQTYMQIAKNLHLPQKTVDNALYRIKKKMKNQMKYLYLQESS
ncbi:sigma-70 family RNA polymerase sigma factor [Priestia megaterium]|jgi:RNA polymerase sporulation-specific sigma factor|uniref:sigma-70 family RNA polymerase sigma factor n=1 Tax=Priestia megaterium TaxID=1404 RepID=UPI00077D806B|nr:sigma-70 family RNA polymerase sigma factor [Priestia megaterium]NGY76180.1 sigma-70 family RNA polymerase sigma factor [Priestia megaterium]QSX23508.1 sigma-70 family RNA polymerase sigma factor [Priestia megaterium]